MNAKKNQVPTEFAPEIRFEVRALPARPFRDALEAAFEELKKQLLREQLEDLADPGLNSQLRGAANEAAALAWDTSFPLLLFPALFQEKAAATLIDAKGQKSVRQCVPDLCAV